MAVSFSAGADCVLATSFGGFSDEFLALSREGGREMVASGGVGWWL